MIRPELRVSLFLMLGVLRCTHLKGSTRDLFHRPHTIERASRSCKLPRIVSVLSSCLATDELCASVERRTSIALAYMDNYSVRREGTRAVLLHCIATVSDRRVYAQFSSIAHTASLRSTHLE